MLQGQSAVGRCAARGASRNGKSLRRCATDRIRSVAQMEGEYSKYVNSSTCCAFIQMSEIIYVCNVNIIYIECWILFLRWNSGLVESGNDLHKFKRQGRKCCTPETYTVWWAKFYWIPRHNFEVPKEVEVPVQRQAAEVMFVKYIKGIIGLNPSRLSEWRRGESSASCHERKGRGGGELRLELWWPCISSICWFDSRRGRARCLK